MRKNIVREVNVPPIEPMFEATDWKFKAWEFSFFIHEAVGHEDCYYVNVFCNYFESDNAVSSKLLQGWDEVIRFINLFSGNEREE
jgi:hypothetical protein